MTDRMKKAMALLAAEIEKSGAAQVATIQELQAASQEELKSLGVPGADGPGTIEAFRAEIKGQIDALAEQVRAAQKLGLALRGGQVHIPGGREARREMLRDKRGFLDDDQAERFAGFVIASLRPSAASARALEIQKDVLGQAKADALDPAVSGTGGALIPNEFRAELIRNVEAEGIVFPDMRRVPLFTIGQTTWPKRTAGMTAYPTAAGALIKASIPTLGTITMQPVKWGTLSWIPNEFFRSTVLAPIGQWLAIEISYALAYAFDESVVNGDGSADYGGITGLLQSATISSVTPTVDHDEAAELDWTDIGVFDSGLTKAYALRNARWYMSLSMKGHCRNLRSTTGEPLYQRGGDGEPNTIDGYPYTVSNHFPARAAVGAAAKWAAFGDLRLSHMFGMLGQVQIDTDSSVGFPSDTTCIRGLAHVDCQEQDANAAIIAKTAS